MIRCGECKFWGDHSNMYEQDRRYRECERIVHGEKRQDDPEAYQLAETMDGSGFYAALLTREDFGCVAGEPSDPEPTR